MAPPKIDPQASQSYLRRLRLSDAPLRKSGQFSPFANPARHSLLTAAPGRLLVALAVVETAARTMSHV